jgi:FkbM family methyltransferase
MRHALRRAVDRYRTLRRQYGFAGAITYLAQERRFHRPGPAYHLVSRHARHPLWVRPETSDLDVFHQIFRSREYWCLQDEPPASLVIDCGANVGYSAAWMLTQFPTCDLIAVEPDPGNYELLKRNLAPYGKRAKTLRSAIWSHRTGLKISETPYRDGREWSVQCRPCQDRETPDLEAIDLGTLIRESGHKHVSVLKIDIEAAEAVVFAENYESWLELVDTLVIELHDEHCSAVFHRAVAGQGFEFSRSGELTVCKRRTSVSARAA